MNVAVNGLLLRSENSGVEQTILGLLRQLARLSRTGDQLRLTLILGKNHLSAPAIGTSPPIEIIEAGIDPQKRLLRIAWENMILPLKMKRRGVDLYHSPGYVLPLLSFVPSVVTVHDTIALQFPGWCKPSNAIYYRWFLPQAVKRAVRIIAVSETVKADLVSRFEISKEKISVVYPGIDAAFKPVGDKQTLAAVRSRYGLPERFVLFVGNIEPKKNVTRLLEAFSRVKAGARPDLGLVITGRKGWKYRDVFEAAMKPALREAVLFTGYCPREDLPSLYSMADLFAFPSLYEGFGIPPLEAMACRTPVLASDRGALPETTGGCALLVDPESVEAIAEGMVRLLSDDELRTDFVERGVKWAGRFTWERAAAETIRVYEQALVETRRLTGRRRSECWPPEQ